MPSLQVIFGVVLILFGLLGLLLGYGFALEITGDQPDLAWWQRISRTFPGSLFMISTDLALIGGGIWAIVDWRRGRSR